MAGCCLVGKQIAPRPDRFGNTGAHGGSHTDRTMNFAEVKREYKQSDSRFHIVPLAAESVRQSGQSAHPHSDSQVCSLNVAGANQIAVRIADPRLNDSALQFGRTVAGRAFRHSSVDLDKLTIIDSRSKTHTDSLGISGHSVSRKLKVARSRFIQLFDKDFRIVAGASAKVPSQDKFGASFNCQERPSVALPLVVRIPFVSLFAITKSPQFVGLNFVNLESVDPVLQDALTLVASNGKNAKDGRNSNVAQSSGTANATAFRQAIENAKQFFVGQIDRLNWFACSLRERALTVTAFESVSFIAAKMAVKVGIVTAVIRALHRDPSSFLTRITVGNTIAVTGLAGINSASQVKNQGSVSSTSPDSRLVRATRLERAAISLVGCCSFQLSYARILIQRSRLLHLFSPESLNVSANASKRARSTWPILLNQAVTRLAVYIVALNLVAIKSFQNGVNRWQDILRLNFVSRTLKSLSDGNGRDISVVLNLPQHSENRILQAKGKRKVVLRQQVCILGLRVNTSQRAKSHDALLKFGNPRIHSLSLGIQRVSLCEQFGKLCHSLIKHCFVVVSINHLEALYT